MAQQQSPRPLNYQENIDQLKKAFCANTVQSLIFQGSMRASNSALRHSPYIFPSFLPSIFP